MPTSPLDLEAQKLYLQANFLLVHLLAPSSPSYNYIKAALRSLVHDQPARRRAEIQFLTAIYMRAIPGGLHGQQFSRRSPEVLKAVEAITTSGVANYLPAITFLAKTLQDHEFSSHLASHRDGAIESIRNWSAEQNAVMADFMNALANSICEKQRIFTPVHETLSALNFYSKIFISPDNQGAQEALTAKIKAGEGLSSNGRYMLERLLSKEFVSYEEIELAISTRPINAVKRYAKVFTENGTANARATSLYDAGRMLSTTMIEVEGLLEVRDFVLRTLGEVAATNPEWLGALQRDAYLYTQIRNLPPVTSTTESAPTTAGLNLSTSGSPGAGPLGQ